MALEVQKDIQHPLIKPALKRQAKNPDHNSLLKLLEPIFQLRAIQIQVPWDEAGIWGEVGWVEKFCFGGEDGGVEEGG